MITQFFITGDTHGEAERFIHSEIAHMENVGIIILGDSGCNFYKSKTKQHEIKSALNELGCIFYMVRGNHEDRPQNIEGIEVLYDENICGDVFYEPGYPAIRYLQDGDIYSFNGHKTLVVGGAYSVDKWYRLRNHWTWYPSEQLTEEEMTAIFQQVEGQSFDFVFTHTCPLAWQPRDLFLSAIDQTSVDNSMEKWFDTLKDAIKWDTWLFGHYHEDRIERPHVEMFYGKIENLESVWFRWHDENALDPSYYPLSPNYDKPV